MGKVSCMAVPLDRKISLSSPLNYRLIGEQNFFNELINALQMAGAHSRGTMCVAEAHIDL
jgi:hypothetical protein